MPSTAAIYLDPDGTSHDVGTTIRNPDLAKTYAMLGREGMRKGFYTGKLADAIVQAADHPPLAPTADHTWRPGLLTDQDMASYQVIERKPVHTVPTASTCGAWARRPRAARPRSSR